MSTQPAVYCPHGYDECWQGCVYPGRCGRFTNEEDEIWAELTKLLA